mmetsp:Transcript_73640/g.219805  ORF Transcript_73640/g.219805 Transcript_73640/m.219805 type:complete len:158 (-) Transcript_73640:166-639(-)
MRPEVGGAAVAASSRLAVLCAASRSLRGSGPAPVSLRSCWWFEQGSSPAAACHSALHRELVAGAEGCSWPKAAVVLALSLDAAAAAVCFDEALASCVLVAPAAGSLGLLEEVSVMSMRVFSNVLTDWLGTKSVCGSVWPVTGLFRDVSNQRAMADRS